MDKRLEQTKTAITIMATAQVMHYALDDVQDAPWYRHSFKAACKNMEREATRTCDTHIANLWELDEGIIQQISSGIEEVCKTLAGMDPAKIAEIGILLKKLNEEEDGKSNSKA